MKVKNIFILIIKNQNNTVLRELKINLVLIIIKIEWEKWYDQSIKAQQAQQKKKREMDYKDEFYKSSLSNLMETNKR